MCIQYSSKYHKDMTLCLSDMNRDGGSLRRKQCQLHVKDHVSDAKLLTRDLRRFDLCPFSLQLSYWKAEVSLFFCHFHSFSLGTELIADTFQTGGVRFRRLTTLSKTSSGQGYFLETSSSSVKMFICYMCCSVDGVGHPHHDFGVYRLRISGGLRHTGEVIGRKIRDFDWSKSMT